MQAIIATHSPILMGHPGAAVLSFDGGRIREVAYEDTAHYRVTRDFLADPQAGFPQALAAAGEQASAGQRNRKR